MNPPSRTAPPSRDAPTLLALAAGLAMGHVVSALAEHSAESTLAMPSALVFLVFGCAGVVCALVAVPRPRWVGPRIGRWIAALGVGLLGALAPPLFF